MDASNQNNEFGITNINNISRKTNTHNSDKMTNEKLASYTMNLSSLNRLTPKENKIESRIDTKSISNNNALDIVNKKIQTQNNTKLSDEKSGKYSFPKMNRIGDSTRSDDYRLDSNQNYSNKAKYEGSIKDKINSAATSKLQRIEIERFLGNSSKISTPSQIKNKTLNGLISSHSINPEHQAILNSNKNFGYPNFENR